MAGIPSTQHLFANLLRAAYRLCGRAGAAADLSRVVVERPRIQPMAIWRRNAAMVLAKEARTKPRELAEKIASRLWNDEVMPRSMLPVPDLSISLEAVGLGGHTARRVAGG